MKERKESLHGTASEKSRNFVKIAVYPTENDRMRKRLKIR